MKCITLISKFATNELSGHALVDDEYYCNFLVKKKANFQYYTSRFSAERIYDTHPNYRCYVRNYEDEKIKVVRSGRVVFVGFSEREVIVFLARNLFKLPRLVLIATNNFSSGRIKRSRWQLRLFLACVSPFLERLVLHTAYERDLVVELAPSMKAKVFVKKHHLMTPRSISCLVENKKPVISYFGPIKPDKPIEPVLDLIKADSNKIFSYRLCGIDRTAIEERLAKFKSFPNVEVFESWVDEKSYFELVRSSNLLFLTHSREFEGKLSGNLCDCVALCVPYIAREMEPMKSYHSQYGPLGFIFEFEKTSWARNFINRYNQHIYEGLQCNLKRMGNDHSKRAIELDLNNCLLN